MSRTIYYTATTLDGFIADPNDSLDWLLRQPQGESGSQDENGSQSEAEPQGETQNQDTEQGREDPGDYERFIAGVGAMVMGSTTYEWVLRHESGVWPYRMPTWVMTHRELTMPTNANDEDRLGIRFAQGNVTEVHAEMRGAAAGKDIWVVGGGDLAGQFAEAGLLDEVISSIAPVTLGAGRPLLPRRLDLELVETGRNGAFLTARHRVVGPLAEDRD
ncbi:dihydrofolate reductase family protein [Brevibacterium sp.]|uniref:dihydrofolate reductase family protein n=1 Tax=Brevibacterium sp. TaxID=1701 RepID=UPI002810F9F7|nr:dihydrofolate reductase family protein [Brevibacterium sp.]